MNVGAEGSWRLASAARYFNSVSASLAFLVASAMSPFLQAASALRIRALAWSIRGAWMSWLRGD